jgi:hypothetical protein
LSQVRRNQFGNWTMIACAFVVLVVIVIRGADGSQSLLTGGQAATAERDAFVRECMEADLLWKKGSAGWDEAARRRDMERLSGTCAKYFFEGTPTANMRAVRAGQIRVRG